MHAVPSMRASPRLVPTHRRPCRSRNTAPDVPRRQAGLVGLECQDARSPAGTVRRWSRSARRPRRRRTGPACWLLRSRSSAGSVVNVPSGGADDEAVAIETDEEAAGRILQQRPNDVPCQALIPAERRDGAVAQPDRAGLDRPNPESPFAILVHRAHAIRRESRSLSSVSRPGRLESARRHRRRCRTRCCRPCPAAAP